MQLSKTSQSLDLNLDLDLSAGVSMQVPLCKDELSVIQGLVPGYRDWSHILIDKYLNRQILVSTEEVEALHRWGPTRPKFIVAS